MTHKKPTLLFIPILGQKVGLGHLSRCLSLASSSLNTQNVILCGSDVCLDAFHFENVRLIKHINELSSCDLIISDQLDKNPHLLEKVKTHYGCPLVCLDLISCTTKLPDLIINLVEHPPFNSANKEALLTGLEYAIINKRFLPVRVKKSAAKEISSILIMYGGSDPAALTPQALSFLNTLPEKYTVNIILGPLNQHRSAIDCLTSNSHHKISIFQSPKSLEDKMNANDVAFCGCGTTLFELSYLGVPSIVSSQNEIERSFIEKIAHYGITINSPLSTAWKQVKKQSVRQEIVEKQQTLFDGKGANRILTACNLLIK